MTVRAFINGTFDILHRGHLELLWYAKHLSHEVWVAIDTDERVKELKGPDRPIINLSDRRFFLESLKCVDKVVTFSTDQELVDRIRECSPSFIVKGGDYRDKPIIGAELCPEIIFFERIDEYSTTKIIQDIINRR